MDPHGTALTIIFGACCIYVDITDYNGGNFNVCFPIGVTRVSFNITIINDDEPPLEADEEFRIKLNDFPINVTSSGAFATVTIQDDCTRVCQNGGTLNSTSCTCACTADYTGLSCEGEFGTIFCMAVYCTDTHRMGTA